MLTLSSLAPGGSQSSQTTKAQMARERALQMPILGNRARMETGNTNYTIAPRSNVNAGPRLAQPGLRADAMVRKLKMKHTGKTK
jgi:transcription factor SPN1